MIAFVMESKAFGGLHVEVHANADDIEEIRFASTGRLLPAAMERKFRACVEGMYRVGDEVWSAEYEGR